MPLTGDPLAVLCVHPCGIAHRGYIKSTHSNGYRIEWVPRLPIYQPVLSYFIRYDDLGVTWLRGFEHSNDAIEALRVAAALAREDD